MARRRSNGEGTTYPRKDGRWEGAAYVLTTSGERKRVRVYGKTQAEARQRLAELIAQNDQGIPTADKALKLGDYLDYWLTEVVKPNRRPATYAQCETIVRLYLKPGLGDQLINKLSAPLLQRYANQLLADGHSVSKVHVVKKILSTALTRAEREEVVTRNPARLIELPTLEPGEVEPWSITEASQFLTVARSHRLYGAFLLLMLYGLRRGEVLGLRWQDIDTEKNELHLRQQLQRVGQQLLTGPLKTRASKRDLPLLGPVLRALHDYRERHAVRKTELIFTSTQGTPIDPDNFRRTFQTLCKQHGLRVIKMHALRHTAATILKDLGVPARDTQLILGHSRITTTQELYQHTDTNARRSALERLEGALLGPDSKTKTAPSVRSGLPVVVGDDSGSRQLSRQMLKMGDTITSIISGGAYRIRTDDLFHAICCQETVQERVTEMDRKLKVGRRRWLLGVVAVNLAVKERFESDKNTPYI
ncbi:tyrosine-type recombinase/integrase [Streptomyces sp. NPDC048385]|uniref:tyrosine-type recombinase/integrase n=1 Tax=Streptomyces sp. NPDC048385 TaxID=3155145 RepID=UPI0034365619